ncbi:hypothetical protein BHE74_00006529 [Ensete ventricosum]|uniref:Uncharacterized protein n=1 Tax=Ensete ventricosum TaxID=4639 RepID=A0A444EHC9_ENSVE|nr:hypothetical protein GW17_00026758 [Ensete ventricosum]RWW84846.1 hypothetical protein BHE74_00006529 [Ensete ventricosum]RZR71167.1 hypothetical protein BHM03_00003934 [Ensete ventricosum]
MSVASALGCGAAFLRHLSSGSRSGSTLILLRAGRTKPRPYSSSLARCAAPEPPDVSAWFSSKAPLLLVSALRGRWNNLPPRSDKSSTGTPDLPPTV